MGDVYFKEMYTELYSLWPKKSITSSKLSISERILGGVRVTLWLLIAF